MGAGAAPSAIAGKLHSSMHGNDSFACHLLLAPKPTAIMYGLANEGLMFYECPTTGTFQPKVDNAKMAKVTVKGESMTISEIVEHLKRIVPVENFQWEVQHYYNNVYKVEFPNKTEVQQAKNFQMYKVPDKDTDLLFDIWSSVEEPLYLLPEVWVQIAGVPLDVRTDFLALWGLGTLMGKTMKVDMAYTWKNKVARMFIGCADHTLIPDTMDVFIKKGFYKLDFVVELVVVFQDATMIEAQDGIDDDKDGNGGHDEEGKGGTYMDMDTMAMSDNQGGNNTNQKPTLVGGGEVNSNFGQAHIGAVSLIKFGKIEGVSTVKVFEVDSLMGLTPAREELTASGSVPNLHALGADSTSAGHAPVAGIPAIEVTPTAAAVSNVGAITADHATLVTLGISLAAQCTPTKGLVGLARSATSGRET
ncbi:hypothetical protein ACQ4PT_022003 [Festuca glaucescens]